MSKLAVAMSGGVDSSVAAALLADAGHKVVGFTLNLWPEWLPEPDDAFKACCGMSAIEDARAVCRQLGIRHYVLNMRAEFEHAVIGYFVDEYAAGRTPNPCIACNQAIKFSLLLNKITTLGIEGLATGHYARVEWDATTGRHLLLRGRDPHKDQSYLLSGLTQSQLARVRFPVGELTKNATRQTARHFGLAVADKPDSQEICFVPRGSYTDVVARFRPEAMRPGPILDVSGNVVGEHQGLARYTIGQRRGLGVAGSAPHYVIGLDRVRNALIVGEERDLLCTEVVATNVNWIALQSFSGPTAVTARIRHASRDVAATIVPGTAAAEIVVRFAQPQRAAAPGQAVTFYDGERVVGGGIITQVRNAVAAGV